MASVEAASALHCGQFRYASTYPLETGDTDLTAPAAGDAAPTFNRAGFLSPQDQYIRGSHQEHATTDRYRACPSLPRRFTTGLASLEVRRVATLGIRSAVSLYGASVGVTICARWT